MHCYVKNAGRNNLLCYLICAILICPAVICRSVNKNSHRKKMKHVHTFTINEFEDINKLEFNNRIFDDDIEDKNNDFNKAVVKSSNSFDVNYPIVTSCGEPTCENVENYPKELIRKAFLNSQGFNSKFISKIHKTRQRSASQITAKYNSNRQGKSLSAKMFLKTREAAYVHQEKCYVEVDTYPEEAQNENYEKVFLAQISENKNLPKGKICSRVESCKDSGTPEGHFWHCVTDYKLKIINFTLQIFDKDDEYIGPQKIRMPNGCKCAIEREV